jgi:hypothetical protein
MRASFEQLKLVKWVRRNRVEDEVLLAISRDVSLVDGRVQFTAASVVVVSVCLLYHMRLDPYLPSNFPAVSWKLKSWKLE